MNMYLGPTESLQDFGGNFRISVPIQDRVKGFFTIAR